LVRCEGHIVVAIAPTLAGAEAIAVSRLADLLGEDEYAEIATSTFDPNVAGCLVMTSGESMDGWGPNGYLT